jgi:hypothetical protein
MDSTRTCTCAFSSFPSLLFPCLASRVHPLTCYWLDARSELCKYGNLLELHICDNVGDHLVGNVYARYEWEAEAAAAVLSCNDRWYQSTSLSIPEYLSMNIADGFLPLLVRQLSHFGLSFLPLRISERLAADRTRLESAIEEDVRNLLLSRTFTSFLADASTSFPLPLHLCPKRLPSYLAQSRYHSLPTSLRPHSPLLSLRL